MKHLKLLFFTAFCLLNACAEDGYRPNFGYAEVSSNYSSDIDGYGGDTYGDFVENPFVETSLETTSTFSIDADGGSYANVRRFIEQDKRLPAAGAVRTEEMINYFNLDYPFSETNGPISLNGEVSSCPWSNGHKLVRIGIKGKELAVLPASNFVFLIDVSGSMRSKDKLSLLKAGILRFVDQMSEEDYLSIVTYAGRSGVHLASTPGRDKDRIRAAVNDLHAGGGTNGGAGIRLAYEQAAANFIEGGNNRIILGSDGDFNVGVSDFKQLVELIERNRETGIFLSVLGLGRGNYRENLMEQLANKGNGTYEYLDQAAELERVFIQGASKFYTVAQDVKIQVKFNDRLVKAYRLLGYENRVLSNEDFTDDDKDAGEIGAGQNITALYEVIPVEGAIPRGVPCFTIDFRYKLPATN
ncbi:MAG: von Willebrand factor type A domain-containing protein, partial [Bacteroidota bacterium]